MILTDIVTGRAYWVARGRYSLAYAEDITEDWEAFLNEQDDLDAEVKA